MKIWQAKFLWTQIVTEGVFITQLSNVGISVWWIVWVMTNCCFSSDFSLSRLHGILFKYMVMLEYSRLLSLDHEWMICAGVSWGRVHTSEVYSWKHCGSGMELASKTYNLQGAGLTCVAASAFFKIDSPEHLAKSSSHPT